MNIGRYTNRKIDMHLKPKACKLCKAEIGLEGKLYCFVSSHRPLDPRPLTYSLFLGRFSKQRPPSVLDLHLNYTHIFFLILIFYRGLKDTVFYHHSVAQFKTTVFFSSPFLTWHSLLTDQKINKWINKYTWHREPEEGQRGQVRRSKPREVTRRVFWSAR